jgi:hypothetical protein
MILDCQSKAASVGHRIVSLRPRHAESPLLIDLDPQGNSGMSPRHPRRRRRYV